MGKVSGLISVLTEDEMELIHNSALRVLAEVGMRIEHEEALATLNAAGCHVDFQRREVRFPPDVVENAIGRMRKDFAVPQEASDVSYGRESRGRRPQRVPMRYTAMYFSSMPRRINRSFDVNTGGFTLFVYDLQGTRRLATIKDVRDSIRLADALDNIDMVGLPCAAN
jgi:trimethylamine:corrinoid methyltransferase-like protein